MSLTSAANLLSSLSAFAISAGLLLNLALQPKRGRADRLFALFGVALLAWGLIGFFPIEVLPSHPALAASAMSLAVFFYFLFINRQIRAENRFTSLLTLASPIMLVVNLVLIWLAQGISGDSEPVVSGIGSIVFILLTLYAVGAFWGIMIALDEQAPRLRGAGLIVIAACALPLLFANLLLNGSLLLMTIATAWIGWFVLRRQLNQPIITMTEELRIANRDVRQAVSEAASLRTRNELLAQELKEAGQYRSDFLDKLGHKLRTPLNSITGYTELLQSGLYGDLTEKQIDRLGKIQRNSDNLLNLISNMLDLNKINAGRLDLTRGPLPLNRVIDQVMSAVGPLQAEKNLKLALDLDPALPLIFADEGRICQVLTQVVDNALKFSFEGEIKISARSIHVAGGVAPEFQLPLKGWLKDGDWVLVEVSDSGIGVAPEDQAQIFDEFYQIADSRTEEYFGTGLGLAVAKRLVELHEGVLWMRSAPDQGSTFYLALHAYHKS